MQIAYNRVTIQESSSNILDILLVYFVVPAESPYLENLTLWQKAKRIFSKNKPIKITLNAKQLDTSREQLFEELKKYKPLVYAPLS